MSAHLLESFTFGGDNRIVPALGHIDLAAAGKLPQYHGPWLRGNQLPQCHPGYCQDLRDPLVKFWLAQRGSEYDSACGHQRTVPAHGGARTEYVWCTRGDLNWVNMSLEKDRLAFGSNPVRLEPWDQGAWRLSNEGVPAMGVTLAFAEPVRSARVGNGPMHEIHFLGLPGGIGPVPRLAEPDHLPSNGCKMLLMVFSGHIDLVIPNAPEKFCLNMGSFLYYPAANRYLERPRFWGASSNFTGAVLFHFPAEAE